MHGLLVNASDKLMFGAYTCQKKTFVLSVQLIKMLIELYTSQKHKMEMVDLKKILIKKRCLSIRQIVPRFKNLLCLGLDYFLESLYMSRRWE